MLGGLFRLASIGLLTATLLAGQSFRGGGFRGGASQGFRDGGFRGSMSQGFRDGGFRGSAGMHRGPRSGIFPGFSGRQPGIGRAPFRGRQFFGTPPFGRHRGFGFRGFRRGSFPRRHGAILGFPGVVGFWPPLGAGFGYPLAGWYPDYSLGYAPAPRVIVYPPPQPVPGRSPVERKPRPRDPKEPKQEPPDAPGGNPAPQASALPRGAVESMRLAFHNGTVYEAIAEWRTGDFLHFVTPDGRHLIAPLATLDSGLTDQLNSPEKARLPTNAGR